MVEVINKHQAAALFLDGDRVIFNGSSGLALAESVIVGLEERFKAEGSPRDLTLMSVVSVGDRDTQGFSRLAMPGLAKRIISGGLNNCPKFAQLAIRNEIEAYTLPQGVLSQITREMSAGRPGLLTKVGIHTFVDPRSGGGKQSACAREDLVKLLVIDGETYLFYPSLPVDVAVIRGSVADENGNITMDDEAFFGEAYSMAATAHLHGRMVIAQVRQLAAAHSLKPKDVKVPGILVDYVVVDPDQMQTYATKFDAAFAGWVRRPDNALPKMPHDIRKCIARRAAFELNPGAVVNLGFGVSTGVALVAAEEGFYRDITLTVEQGIIGGIPNSGLDSGSGLNFGALIDQAYQFDFYDGGGLDTAYLSFAEVDAKGNVNVSRYEGRVNGPGGFINVAQGTKNLVLSGTLTTGGLSIRPNGRDGVVLKQEGRIQKFVPEVQQITYGGQCALDRGQSVLYVTDRAVFRLTPNGLELTEFAKGVNIERDIRSQIGFPVRIAENAKFMDARIFKEEPMGLRDHFAERT